MNNQEIESLLLISKQDQTGKEFNKPQVTIKVRIEVPEYGLWYERAQVMTEEQVKMIHQFMKLNNIEMKEPFPLKMGDE